MIKLLKTVKLIYLLYDVYFMCMSIMLYNCVKQIFAKLKTFISIQRGWNYFV